MDDFLLAVTIILAIILICVNFYLLALYCHRNNNEKQIQKADDAGWGSSLFCKILVIFGLTLSWAQVLMLPLDAANSRGLGGGIDMASFWQIVYMMILIMVTLLLPFAQFFYETDEDKSMVQNQYDLKIERKMLQCSLLVVCLLLFISYGFLRYAQIPVYKISQNFSNIQQSNSKFAYTPSAQKRSDITLEYEVTFPIFAMAFMSFFGYILFVCFGGVGLTALPIDMITDYTSRPKILSTREGAEKKSLLKKKTQELIELGGKIKDDAKEATVIDGWWSKYKEERKVKGSFNKYKLAVLNLEREYQIFKLELEYMSTNPFIYILKMILGIIFAFISFFWWLHILLFIVLKNKNGYPIHPFFNNLLTGLENGNAGFISTAVFAFLSLYLLWCTQKGNIKFGLRIPFIFSLHIMKVNETWMNTFLFNVTLMLICSVAVTQFCTKAFSQYVRMSSIDSKNNILQESDIQYSDLVPQLFHIFLQEQCL